MKLFVTLFLLLTLLAPSAEARKLLSTETTCTGTDVVASTTDEKVIATQVVPIPQATAFLVRVRVYFTMTTSADSTAYTIAVRRNSLTGDLVATGIAEGIKVTAGGVEAGYYEFSEERSGSFSALTYVSTLDMTGATGDTTVSQNCITVDILQ